MDERVRILLIDDDEDEYFLLNQLFSGQTKSRTSRHYELDWVSAYAEAVQALSACQYDVYLLDYHLGKYTGLDLLQEETVKQCAAPIIMLTGRGSYETDLSAMHLGIADYLEKSELTPLLLERSIRYAMERKQAAKQLESLLQERTKDLSVMKKQAQELRSLQKATSSLLHTLDVSRLMGQILDAAREAIPSAEQGWLHLVERDAGRGQKLTQLSLSDPRIQRVKPYENLPDSLRKIQEGHSLRIDDLQAEPALLSFLEREQRRVAARSLVIAPLTLDGEVLGTLSLSSLRAAAFSEGDLQLLASFAATATAAIHNAILYSETQNQASTDPLTGQLNRRTFFELSQREIERYLRFGRPLSWIMFDVDLFKRINDTYGHVAGDQTLIEIGERCCRIIRHVDIFGRYGGDEFVILLPETNHQKAREIAERIRTAISTSPIETSAGAVSVSISIGITEVTPETADLGLLLNKVDQALYRSKRAGRNTATVLI